MTIEEALATLEAWLPPMGATSVYEPPIKPAQANALHAALRSVKAEIARLTEEAEGTLLDEAEEVERLAAEKGIPFALDHIGLDGMANDVVALQREIRVLTFTAEHRFVELGKADDEVARLREGLATILHRAETRRIGIRMDGSEEWAVPLAGEVAEIARALLAEEHIESTKEE